MKEYRNQIFDSKFKLVKDYLLIIAIFLASSIILILGYLGISSIWIIITSISSFAFIAIKDVIDKRKDNLDEIERKLTADRIKNIDELTTKKNLELEYKHNIMAEFLRNGVVKESDLIENLNQQSFTILYHFNRKLDNKLKPFLPNNKKAIDDILESLGFVPVGYGPGSYFFHIVNTNSLPKPLNNITYLEAYIRKKITKNWDTMWSNVKERNKTLYRKFEKNRKNHVNLIYVLGKIFPSNLSVGYINFSSFDKKFLAYYSQFSNPKTLNINLQKYKDLISLASLHLFITQIEPKDRIKISQNESEIKKELGVTNLWDYETVAEEKWINELSKLFNKEKSENYSQIIMNSIRHYCPIIKEYS